MLHQCLPQDKLLHFQYKDEMGNTVWVKIAVCYENNAERIHKMCGEMQRFVVLMQAIGTVTLSSRVNVL